MDSFKPKYEQFAAQFDKLINEDQFKGDVIDKLAKDFLRQNQDFLDSIPYGSLPNSTYPKCSSSVATEEDFQLFLSPENNPKASPEAQLCSEVYRRVARSTYLHQTLLRLRNPKDSSDRHECFEFARIAIRHNAHNVDAVIEHALGKC